MLRSKPSDNYAPGTKHSLINYSKVDYWSPKPPLFALYMWRGEKEWWQYWVNVGFVEKKLEFPTKLVWKGENTCWSIWFTPHKLIHVCDWSTVLWVLIWSHWPESFEVFVLILWDQHLDKSSMLQSWSNCGYQAEARKAVPREPSSGDDSWATCLLGRDQSPRLPRKGLASVV